MEAGFFAFGTAREGNGMKRQVWMWIILAGLAVLSAGCGSQGSKPPTTVVCTCFLNEHPCESSRRLEAWTKDALEAGFAPDLQSGRITFRSINYDLPENAHYLRDYALPFQSIVLQDSGNPKRWVRLDKLWEMIGDQKVFRQYVQDETGKFIADRH
jgi:hypothetical protein